MNLKRQFLSAIGATLLSIGAFGITTPTLASPLASFCGPSSGNGCEDGTEQMVFLQDAKGVTTGFGNIGSQKGTPIMKIVSDGGLLNMFIDLSNGFATIKPENKQTTFNGLDISVPGFTFTKLVFDEQLTPVKIPDPNHPGKFIDQASDPFTILVNDTLGTQTGNESDAADTDKEFSVTALQGAFKDINISALGGFDEIKHIEIEGLDPITSPVPLPGALPLFIGGLTGLGVLSRWRRKNTTSHDLSSNPLVS
jgi:hypothetical protein